MDFGWLVLDRYWDCLCQLLLCQFKALRILHFLSRYAFKEDIMRSNTMNYYDSVQTKVIPLSDEI